MFRGENRSVAVSTGVLLAMLLFCGCKKSAPPTPTATTPSANRAVATEVEDQLKSALYQLQPENLGIDSRIDDAVSVLNNWWSAVKSAKLEPTGLTPPAIPEALLPANVRELLDKELYDNQDGQHIRSSYFAKQIGDHVGSPTDKELDRVIKAFEWVCRNITLLAEDEVTPPLGFYELLVFGRGRPFDRAMVFGEILRQLRLDSVVLYPSGALEADSPWLMGVLLDGKVYLFDPRLGLPIPNGDAPKTGRITQPATLEEILAHPEWLTPLAARSDQPFEPSVEQLQSAQVGVLTPVMGWSARMWRLEQLLPGDQLCVLYDPPAKLGDAPSVFERVATSFPGKTLEQIERFVDPLLRTEMDARDRTEVMRALQMAQSSLLAPFAANNDDKAPGGRRAVPTQRQLKTRTLQLQGRYADAIAQYVSIRQLGVTPPPDATLALVYARAAEDAFYWSCLCKVDSNQLESATQLLSDYLKRYRRGGRWLVGARQALADCHLARNQTAEAIETLKMSLPDDPARASTAVQIKWLSGLSAEKTE